MDVTFSFSTCIIYDSLMGKILLTSKHFTTSFYIHYADSKRRHNILKLLSTKTGNVAMNLHIFETNQRKINIVLDLNDNTMEFLIDYNFIDGLYNDRFTICCNYIDNAHDIDEFLKYMTICDVDVVKLYDDNLHTNINLDHKAITY